MMSWKKIHFQILLPTEFWMAVECGHHFKIIFDGHNLVIIASFTQN